MNIKINIEDSQRKEVNINLAWGINVAEPEAKGFGKIASLFRKKFHIEKTVTVDIENLDIDPKIDRKENDLLVITMNGKRYESADLPLTCDLKALNTPFQLFLDTAAITDCKEQEQRVKKAYPITFDVVLSDSKGNEIDRVKEQINVSFQNIDCKPEVRLVLPSPEIQYTSSLREVEIGYVTAWIDKDKSYASGIQLSVNLDLLYNEQQLSGLLYFKEKGQKTTSCEVEIQPGKKRKITEKVYIDFTNLSNPIADIDKYAIRQKLSYAMSYSKDVIIPMMPKVDILAIKKDKQGTELKLFVNDNVMRSGDIYDFEGAFPPCSNMMLTVPTRIVNIASSTAPNPLVGLCIKNFSIRERLQDGTALLDDENNIINTTIAELRGRDVQKMTATAGYIIKNAPAAQSSIDIRLNPSKVADVKGAGSEFRFIFNTIVSFDYFENRDGLPLSGATWKHFTFTISWHLQLLPHPEWLSIDFGTSAIVCQYESHIVDLNTQKSKLYTKDYPVYATDTLADGEPFLSSQIIFNNVTGSDFSGLCTEQDVPQPYRNQAVILSPTSSLMDARIWWWLPCLKIMVGNDSIPDSNAYYQTFEYPRKDVKSGTISRITIGESTKTKESNSLARVNQLFLQVYNELFKFFVAPSIHKDERLINKLVLTYPYNYTPRHVKMMKDVANKTFLHIRDGYLTFVSESDAVASYYVDNWNKYNPKGNINEYENVLVYDMGAGTLDITVFRKFKDSKDPQGKLSVKILGHLGSNKAGDYLDYILAEIVNDKLSIDSTNHLVSTQLAANQSEAQARMALKNAVKYNVKPQLDRLKSSLSIKLRLMNMNAIFQNGSIVVSDVLDDERFKRYIDEVTKGVIDKLLSYFNKKKMDIDTLIMSGRSSKLDPLRTALTSALDKVNTKKVKVLYFEDETKTSVVKGAIAKASKFDLPHSSIKIIPLRIYASYGILYSTLGGVYQYKELLNPWKTPETDDEFDTPQILIEGLGNTDKIMLVQTYLSEDKVAKAFMEKDMELISIMGDYDMSAFNNPSTLNVKLHVTTDNDIELFANGMISVPNAPKGTNMQSEDIKRSIWPVTI